MEVFCFVKLQNTHFWLHIYNSVFHQMAIKLLKNNLIHQEKIITAVK